MILREILASIVFAAVVPAGTVMPVNTSAPMQDEGTYYGSTPISTWERLADCESGGDWYINTGNGYYGGLQFWDPTWDDFGGEEFSPYAHQTGKFNQMTIAQRVLDEQGWGAWPYCSRKIGVR